MRGVCVCVVFCCGPVSPSARCAQGPGVSGPHFASNGFGMWRRFGPGACVAISGRLAPGRQQNRRNSVCFRQNDRAYPPRPAIAGETVFLFSRFCFFHERLAGLTPLFRGGAIARYRHRFGPGRRAARPIPAGCDGPRCCTAAADSPAWLRRTRGPGLGARRRRNGDLAACLPPRSFLRPERWCRHAFRCAESRRATPPTRPPLRGSAVRDGCRRGVERGDQAEGRRMAAVAAEVEPGRVVAPLGLAGGLDPLYARRA